MKDLYPNIKWTLTDDSTEQYGRKIEDGIYEFKEKIDPRLRDPEDDDEWNQETIVLAHYTPEEIQSHISGYYDSVDEIYEQYEDPEWIIAECIFENGG